MSLKKNVIASYFGQGWTVLVSLIFVPLYVEYMGIESYGLIGIFAILQSTLPLIDAGLTPAINREMAKFSGGAHDSQSIRTLLRSVEILQFGIATFLAIAVGLASGWLATHWLRIENLTVAVVWRALILMGLVAALRFVEEVYRSCLIGLHYQVQYSTLSVIFSTLRYAGAIGVLIWISPTIEAFLIWQGLNSILNLLVFARLVYQKLPPAPGPVQFSPSALQQIWQFSAGMLKINFFALFLLQIDKVILSKILTLREFGYFSLATMVASSLLLMKIPIEQAFLPRFVELLITDGQQKLAETFHKCAQIVAVLIGAFSIIFLLFSREILQLWTQDPALSVRVAPLVAILGLGNFFNGITYVPNQLQIASGWTSLVAKINLVMLLLIVPALFWVTPIWGPLGAVWSWAILNIGYFAIGGQFLFRRILTQEKWRWYLQDSLLPYLAGLMAAGLLKFASEQLQSQDFYQHFYPYRSYQSQITALLLLSLATGLVLLVTAVAAPMIRTEMARLLQRFNWQKLK